jgi:hypothetical protein
MKERILMTSVLIGSMADVVSTHMGLNLGLKEIGLVGSLNFENHSMTNAYISRIAVTALIIGMYALTKEYPNRLSYSVDKATRIINLITWGVVAMNSIQLIMK